MAIGKYYIGLDPSMAAFGIAIIDVGKQEIILDQLEADSHHDFVLMSWAISNLWNEFYCKYDKYLESDESYVAQEAPISSGINSGKLNALGYSDIVKFIEKINNILNNPKDKSKPEDNFDDNIDELSELLKAFYDNINK